MRDHTLDDAHDDSEAVMPRSRPFDLVLGTSIWSPHMVPLAKELFAAQGCRFKMVVFSHTDQERLRTGWSDVAQKPAWLAGPPETRSEFRELEQVCQQADVALLGAVPTEVMDARASTGKLTLVVAERILKKRYHRLRMLNPRYANSIFRYRRIVNRWNWHSLSIGYYAPADLSRLGLFGDRVWRWAYFVDLNPEPPRQSLNRQIRVVWVGRMLRWKRADLLIRAVARVQHEPWFGSCLLVGDGPEREILQWLARKLKIRADALRFRPPVPVERVRQLMRESDVCVLSSDRQEGWGAVTAEAMSEGCVLLANEQAGSARVLVSHGETGLLFSDGDVDDLVARLRQLGCSPDLRERIRSAAWTTAHESWSARVGAERVLNLVEDLLARNDSMRYTSGLCARCGFADR